MRAIQLSILATSLLFGICGSDCNAGVVYTNDFDGGEAFSGGASGGLSGITTTDGVQGYSGYGNGPNVFSGDFLRNTTTGNPASATVLTLTGLPEHTSISIAFLLAIIDSWDGATTAGNLNSIGDFFNVEVDGVSVFSEAFDEVVLGDSYTPPAGGLVVFYQQLGFSTGPGIGWFDSGYDMGLESALQNISHSASSVTIELYGSGAGYGIGPSTGSDGTDETWAVENLSVSVNAVPEPSSVGLFVVGAIAISRLRTRRTRPTHS